MGLVLYKILAACFIFLASISVFIYLFKKKNALKHTESIELGEAAASGIFLGAAFFHMLPDAINTFQRLYGSINYPIPEAVCVLGFLLLLFMERLSLTRAATHSKNTVAYVLTAILVIHAVIEGAALGTGPTLPETMMLFFAIIAHKASESYALSMTLLRHQLPLSRILLIIILFSFMTPLGIGLGTAINLWTFTDKGELIAALFNAFAAGTFLYISTLHHVRFHKHTEEQQGLLEFTCLIFGLLMMALVAVWT